MTHPQTDFSHCLRSSPTDSTYPAGHKAFSKIKKKKIKTFIIITIPEDDAMNVERVDGKLKPAMP